MSSPSFFFAWRVSSAKKTHAPEKPAADWPKSGMNCYAPVNIDDGIRAEEFAARARALK
jgi:hypothetical protein